MSKTWDGLTPYDEPISIYVGLIEGAMADKEPLHDYQQTLDTLKALRKVWVSAMNSPEVKTLYDVLRKGEASSQREIFQALGAYEAGLKEEAMKQGDRAWWALCMP